MNLPNENTLKTSVQIVVLLSTIIIGSGMNSIAKRLQVDEKKSSGDSFNKTKEPLLLGLNGREALRKSWMTKKFEDLDNNFMIPIFRSDK